MPNYFANGNRFRPPKKETGLPTLESITGVLDYFDIRPGNNPSGSWFVIRLLADDDSFNAFFKPDCISEEDIDLLESLRSRVIRLGCRRGVPVINVISVKYEGDLRAELLKGVAAGTIDKEDLPVLLEYAKGNDDLFALWNIFKKKNANDDMEKVRDGLEKDIERTQAEIERLTAKRDHISGIYLDTMEEVEKMLAQITSALIFLQGEDGLNGTKHTFFTRHSDNLVPVYDGYHNLLDAFEQFKTRKGIFVLCGNSIHKIHHAFLEDKGRAFLLGSSTEFLRSKPEKVKAIIDEIYGLR